MQPEFPFLSRKSQHCSHCLFQKAQKAAAVLSFCSTPSSNKNLWVPKILEKQQQQLLLSFFPVGRTWVCFFVVVVLGADGVVILSK